MTLAADSLTVGWLQTIAAFQIIGVLLTAASVAGALWVIFWRDPALAREREADRYAERQLEARAELERYRAEARAVLIAAERVRYPFAGATPGAAVWVCGVTNRSRSVITDVSVTVSAADENDSLRVVVYTVTDVAANLALGQAIGSGGRVTAEEAADLTANNDATKRENFARNVAPDASSTMFYNVAGVAAHNEAVNFTASAAWTDLRGNSWTRRGADQPKLEQQP